MIIPRGDYSFQLYDIYMKNGYVGVFRMQDRKFGAVDLSTGEFIVPIAYSLVSYNEEKKSFITKDDYGNRAEIPWSSKKVEKSSQSDEVAELRRQVEELKRQVNGQQNSGGNVGSQSGSVQSRQEFRPCFSCGGTRKCHQCTGRRTVVTWAGRNRIEQNCPGCARSGVCPACHGTGGTYETVYY